MNSPLEDVDKFTNWGLTEEEFISLKNALDNQVYENKKIVDMDGKKVITMLSFDAHGSIYYRIGLGE